MALTKEHVKELKSQLKQQIQHLPISQKKEAESQIDSMSDKSIEEMLKQQQSSSGKTIFRMIVDNEVESIKVGENPESIAVLDINPISKGHILIIPKKPLSSPQEIPKSAFSLAEDLSRKIIENLKASSTKAHTEKKFNECVLNLIPLYDKDLDINSKRSKSSIEELKEIKRILETIKIEKKPELIKVEKKKDQDPIKLKRRIP